MLCVLCFSVFPRRPLWSTAAIPHHRAGADDFAWVKDGTTPPLSPSWAAKCAGLRIFADDEGKLNRSAVELGYSALVVSNFTLYGDTSRGKRPSFIHAAKGETAKSAYDAFLQELMNAQGLKDVQHGEFGADMQVSLVNDGPVTIIIDTDEWK